VRVRALWYRFNRGFWGRLVTTGGVLGATLQSYFWLNHTLPPRFDLLTPLDTAIPFLPWTYAVYTSYFALMVGAAWRLGVEEFSRLLGALLLANLVCYLGFILFTAHYPRPALESIPSPWHAGFQWMYASDGAGNTFPSLHVAVSLLGALRLRHHRGGALWLLWAGLISLSTLTVKQHFVVDVLGGAAVAWGAHAVFFSPRSPVEARS
jgi:membrane-associated phospholipid phosphatase